MFVLIFGSCASVDRTRMTKFEPYKGPNNEMLFKFYSQADSIYRFDTEDGEKVRMQWLQTWLKANLYCPNGFDIINKTIVSTDFHQLVKDMYYTGKCR